MDKKQIADVLNDIGLLLELKGELPFKSRAYYNAARAIEMQEKDIDELIALNELKDIKGIGDAITKKITELATTGHLEYYERLKKEIPPGLIEMLKIPGLGPKRIQTLYKKLGITTIGELEYACIENRLLELEGFGRKMQENILKGIQYVKRYQGQFLYCDAKRAADRLLDEIKSIQSIYDISIAGALRRRKEITKDIDMVAASDTPQSVIDAFTALPSVESIIASGDTKASVRLFSGINADLRVVLTGQYPYALHHFTGSKEHNTAMRHRARQMGIKINEYGLFRGEEFISCSDEYEFFHALGLGYIPPELREDMGEIEAAEKGMLPELIEGSDIKGLFHIHTAYSDGITTVSDMVKAAMARGYTYMGISDHSQSAFYAGGLKPEILRRQWREIDDLNRSLDGFHIFKGVECDILPDGSLDYDDGLLSEFDFVIASVHSHFNMTEQQMTARLLAAVSNPYVTILGHPSGRLLLAREEYRLDMDAVIDACAAHGVVMELNANPHRLDMDWRWCRIAKERNVKIAINPDAHDISGLDDMEYGIGIARKGWLEAGDVLNAIPLNDIVSYLERRRRKN
ncbi:DNA polymerase/3'-5' exonuclease PolX [Mahella australiensis]|uniref:DNA polymerase beta n=1 Tax=Mahella australiensis (strain DSM 15567 / CIP 107919 / 50-1 BON) TaxID=697281 RepID=F3ZX85_MAHA5|nr:DNA polymerase/3'-5' exonuclease PolX [Mahella australiensis]AEE96542.1 PHP domain protein [Mahella australiensis 50-1 BON]